jgi:hypothetical protein
MRLLLDESLPKKLKSLLSPHDVRTVPEMGWAAKKNGELLKLADGRFDVFCDCDQKIPKQQNLSKFTLAVVVLAARSNRLQDLRSPVPELLQILPQVRQGQAQVVAGK